MTLHLVIAFEVLCQTSLPSGFVGLFSNFDGCFVNDFMVILELIVHISLKFLKSFTQLFNHGQCRKHIQVKDGKRDLDLERMILQFF
jgi:hypothetical protein